MQDNSPPANHTTFKYSSKIYTMKQAILLFNIVFFLHPLSFGQIEKATWLLGGTGTLSSINNKYDATTVSTEYKRTALTIYPSAGYFILDKLAVGIRSSFSWNKNTGISSNSLTRSNSIRFDYGVFGRYYFIEKEKQYNLLSDISYQFGTLKLTEDNGVRNTFTAMGGVEFFLNTSVGLEFLVGYKTETEKLTHSTGTPPFFYTDKRNGLITTLGFQFHLQKN